MQDDVLPTEPHYASVICTKTGTNALAVYGRLTNGMEDSSQPRGDHVMIIVYTR